MIIPILVLMMPLQAQQQQQVEQQLIRQQQQLEQVHRELFQQQVQLERMLGMLERHAQQAQQERREEPRPVCTVEVRRVNGADQRRVPANVGAMVPLNLFSTISRPNSCLPAEVRVTASYLDAADNLICTGTVETVAVLTGLTQSVNLEIRPWNLREFVRWRNEPPQVNSGPKRLGCLNPEGTAETTSEDLERVTSVRARATVLPNGGGMSTTEVQLNLR